MSEPSEQLPALGSTPREAAEQFATLGRHLADYTDVDDLLQAVVDLTADVVPGAQWVSISRGHGERFTTMAASDPVAVAADRLQYQLGTGPCIDAVLDDAVFESADLALDERWSQFGPQAARDHGTRSVLSMRMVMDGDEDLNAGLNMYGDHLAAFTSESRHFATLMATHAAVAVAAVLNRQQVRQLQTALASNREIGVAMGVLMSSHKLTREQAFDLLRVASQNSNRKLRDIATEVADTGLLPLTRPGRAPSGPPTPVSGDRRHRSTLDVARVESRPGDDEGDR